MEKSLYDASFQYLNLPRRVCGRGENKNVVLNHGGNVHIIIFSLSKCVDRFIYEIVL